MKLLSLVIILVIIPLVVAIPEIPHQFYGTVSNTNGIVNSGILTAKLDNKIFTTQIINGNYGLSEPFLVHREDSSATNIEFYVDNNKVYDFTYQAGAYTQLNLNIPVFSFSTLNNDTDNNITFDDDEDDEHHNNREDIIIVAPQDTNPSNTKPMNNEEITEKSSSSNFLTYLVDITGKVISAPFKTTKNHIITSLILSLLVVSLYFVVRKKL